MELDNSLDSHILRLNDISRKVIIINGKECPRCNLVLLDYLIEVGKPTSYDKIRTFFRDEKLDIPGTRAELIAELAKYHLL